MDPIRLMAEVKEAKGWFERHLIWLIAGGCFALGVIVRQLA